MIKVQSKGRKGWDREGEGRRDQGGRGRKRWRK